MCCSQALNLLDFHHGLYFRNAFRIAFEVVLCVGKCSWLNSSAQFKMFHASSLVFLSKVASMHFYFFTVFASLLDPVSLHVHQRVSRALKFPFLSNSRLLLFVCQAVAQITSRENPSKQTRQCWQLSGETWNILVPIFFHLFVSNIWISAVQLPILCIHDIWMAFTELPTSKN